MDREAVEKLSADVKRRREEAEGKASRAADRLLRVASGLTALSEVDADHVRAAADEFAGAVERLKLLEQFSRNLRALLM
ncbi:MAG: hypothetical protein QGH74_05205 [Candidatus Brocadiia bacterium]|jgi:hypothetical protein|nr:hypothetical protein [Candidatus Brocadiia bacterium]